VDALMGEDFGAKRFNDGIRNIDPIAGPGVGHSGFTGLGSRVDRSSIATFFRVFYGTIVTLAGKPVSVRPGRNPGNITGIIFGFFVWCRYLYDGSYSKRFGRLCENSKKYEKGSKYYPDHSSTT
jgi:hypothetical protein